MFLFVWYADYRYVPSFPTRRSSDLQGVVAFVAPRGIGPTAWDADERKQTHIRRRFLLLGQTLDGMRVWEDRKSTRLNSSHSQISYAVFCLKKKKTHAKYAPQ